MSNEEVNSSDIYLQKHITFYKNKKYMILGNSGQGKSSLLNFIYGKSAEFEGDIKIDDRSSEDFVEVRQKKVSYLFQDFKLFNDLTVFENIQLKNRLTNYFSRKEIENLLEQVQLIKKKDTLVGCLSSGQKQRVALIRSLSQPFEYLLLDEPFSHLDRNNIQLIVSIVNAQLKAREATLIMTSLGAESYFAFDKTFTL